MLVELLSGNYTEIRYTPTAAIAMNTMTLMEDTYGFPLADVAANEEGAFIVKAEKARAEKDGVAILKGEGIYWTSGGTDKITNVAGSDPLVGFCQNPTAIADTEQIFVFDGFAAFLKA